RERAAAAAATAHHGFAGVAEVAVLVVVDEDFPVLGIRRALEGHREVDGLARAGGHGGAQGRAIVVAAIGAAGAGDGAQLHVVDVLVGLAGALAGAISRGGRRRSRGAAVGVGGANTYGVPRVGHGLGLGRG
nr:hypothetical protein [Tanacetum cinerariifolium]